MNFAVLAIGCWLLAQPAADSDPYKPKVVPGKSPPAAIEPDLEPPAEPTPAAPDAQPAEAPAPPAAEPAVPPDVAPAEPAAPEAAAPATEQDDPAQPKQLEPLGNVPKQRLRPPELLAEALATPSEGALAGQPVELVQALSRSADRSQQLRIAQAYWRLATAQAAYHWALDAQQSLERYTTSQEASPAVGSARAAASAEVREAELAVSQAQQELADLVGTTGAGLPLCTDRPHVGNYNTLYEEIFGGRPAPPRIRLIHRTLPIRRKAIDAHAEAIVAALDAVAATGEELQGGAANLPAVLAALAQLQRQRQAFLLAVRDYNQEIAEYLFAVARPGTSQRVLVSQLILTPERARAPTDKPSLPPPPGGSTFEEPAGGAQPAAGDSASHEPRTSNYADEVAASVGHGLYGALASLEPAARVQKLAELLHWDRGLPPDAGQSTPLADCLGGVAPSRRMELVTAYWQARECAARYQVDSELVGQLQALSETTAAAYREPGMAAAAVRLHAARQEAEADLLEANLALLSAEFHLTQVAGRPLEEPWILPATPPQSGRYVVADKVGGPAQHWAAAVTMRHGQLEQRAQAVIQADEQRAGLAAGGNTQSSNTSPLDGALWSVSQQREHSLHFLRDLTEYNIAIARYALATLAPNIPGDELVKKLVIERTARGRS
jgi:hypothetical protein